MKRNVVELAVLVVSIVTIAAVAGVLVYDGLGTDRPPEPRIELRRAEARTTPLGWVVPATVFNDGDEAAERVALEATATVDGAQESSAFEVDFLPSGSEAEVEIAFSAEPEGEIEVRLVGYGLP